MKKKFARFFFIFMSFFMFLGLGAVIVLVLKKHNERNKYPIEKGVVTEIHALQMGGGTYLVKLEGTFNAVSVDGSAFYKAYAIGEEVEVLMKPNELRILNSKNVYFISFGLGAICCFMFCIPLIGFLGKKKTNGAIVFFVGLGFILMGMTTVSAIRYGKTEDKVFTANSDVTMGKISGFHTKTCETRKKPKRKYPCHACLIDYPLPDGTVHQFKASYRSEKEGNVGDEIKMRYLLSNPKEAKVFVDDTKRSYFYIAMYGFALLLISLGSFTVHAVGKGK